MRDVGFFEGDDPSKWANRVLPGFTVGTHYVMNQIVAYGEAGEAPKVLKDLYERMIVEQDRISGLVNFPLPPSEPRQ